MAQFASELRTSAKGPVATRHLQPDGAAVRAHVIEGRDGTLVTDSGDTVAAMRRRVTRLSQRVRLTIEGICRMNDLTFERGAVAVVVEPGGDVHDAIDRLGRACARIARLKLE